MSLYQFKARFDDVVTASLNFDNNLLLAQASLEPLKSLIPESVNLEKNVDLVGAAFNAAVVNTFNKNGDGIDTNTAIAFKNYFIHKPTNIEHKKQRVVGHIVNSSFSSYGSNELLTDNQVKNSLSPFNIALAAVVYKTVDRDFADALVESNDPDSNLYQKISASWEIGFNKYFIAVGSSNLSEAEVVTDEKHIEELKKYLRGFDGPGTMNDGTPVYRLVTGRIYPLGIGFTTNPAANVAGVVIDDGSNTPIDEDSEAEEIESIEVNTLELLKIKKNISQNHKQPVNKNKNKIMELEQLLSELKTVLAEKQNTEAFSEEAVANISERIAESIKMRSDEIQAKIAAAEQEKVQAVAQAEQLKKDLEDNNSKLSEALSRLNELESTLSAQAAQELFNSRMSSLDAEYEFDDQDRQLLAKELNGLEGTDEAFATYKEKLAVIYRHKSKAYKSEQEKVFQERLESELAKRMSEVRASTTEEVKEEKTVEVETALANAKEEDSAIPAQNIDVTETMEQLSWRDRMKKAFSKDSITIKL